VVMGGHLLHPELTPDVSGAVHAHSLQEMLILMKLLGASCWKPGPVPSSLCSARFSSRSPSFFSLDDSYCDTTGI